MTAYSLRPREHRMTPVWLSSRKALASSLASLLGVAPCPATLGATLLVTNCNDSGSGSLRDAVAAATAVANYDNDIQFHLPASCTSTITLTTGAVPITQPGILILDAPGPGKIAISGDKRDRIFNATQRGSFLGLYNLYMFSGLATGSSVAGGCISSRGQVKLVSSIVTECEAKGTYAYGGAIWAGNGLRLYNSRVVYNAADGAYAYGGGIYVIGGVDIENSTVSGNHAYAGLAASAGGVSASGGATINASAITANVVETDAGTSSTDAGVEVSGGILVIHESTISGNINRSGSGGGLRFSGTHAAVYGSTIAFNFAAAGVDSSGRPLAPGFAVTGGDLVMYNTLMSNNTDVGHSNDFSTVTGTNVAGSTNLVGTATGALPTGVIVACPLLGPLRDNGGPTWTHALLSHSPAIDHGTSDLPDSPPERDQRGFPAPSPAGGKLDIGAYEVQQDDIVFNAGFDGC